MPAVQLAGLQGDVVKAVLPLPVTGTFALMLKVLVFTVRVPSVNCRTYPAPILSRVRSLNAGLTPELVARVLVPDRVAIPDGSVWTEPVMLPSEPVTVLPWESCFVTVIEVSAVPSVVLPGEVLRAS